MTASNASKTGPALVAARRFDFGMVAYEGADFLAYDPNDPDRPACLTNDGQQRAFSLPANRYWRGGKLNVFEIARRWYR